MNDNQNHRIREGRTSSRVIAQPGGGGSLMLGIAPPPRKVESGKEPYWTFFVIAVSTRSIPLTLPSSPL